MSASALSPSRPTSVCDQLSAEGVGWVVCAESQFSGGC